MTAVDVIIPVFNTPLHYVVAALNSVRDQSLSDWSAWIVDDGSEKSYAAALKERLDVLHDRRFSYTYTDHKGAGGSRNVVIAKGQAPYVAFLDSDDCWTSHHLFRQVTLLDARNDVDLVHGHCVIIDADGRVTASPPPRTGLNDMTIVQSFVRMLEGNYVVLSTAVVRRRLLEKVGGFDGTFPSLADKELWIRLLGAGARFHHDQEVVVQYRVHPGNTSKKTDLLLATRHRIIEKAEHVLKGNELLAGVNWPAIRKKMVRHMYLEAAEAHLEGGRYSEVLKFGSPFRSGLSRRSCILLARALYRSVNPSARSRTAR